MLDGKADVTDGSGEGFNTLAGYLFGNNTLEVAMDMTTPVNIDVSRTGDRWASRHVSKQKRTHTTQTGTFIAPYCFSSFEWGVLLFSSEIQIQCPLDWYAVYLRIPVCSRRTRVILKEIHSQFPSPEQRERHAILSWSIFRTMSFVMPEDVPAGEAPIPRDPRVSVNDVPSELLAVREFAGDRNS